MLLYFVSFYGTNIRAPCPWNADFLNETTKLGSETDIRVGEIYRNFDLFQTGCDKHGAA